MILLLQKLTSLSFSLSLLQVSLLTVTLVYYVYYIYHSIIILEVVELLQRHNYRGHVDVSLLATWEQVRERKKQENKYLMLRRQFIITIYYSKFPWKMIGPHHNVGFKDDSNS